MSRVEEVASLMAEAIRHATRTSPGGGVPQWMRAGASWWVAYGARVGLDEATVMERLREVGTEVEPGVWVVRGPPR